MSANPILSSDSDAVERLTAEIASLEAQQTRMKAANAVIRKHNAAGSEAQWKALVELGFSQDHAIRLLKPDFCGRIGFPQYELTNNGANLRRLKGRLLQVAGNQVMPVIEKEGTAAMIEDDPPANRIRLSFPGKPSEAVRTELKRNGFRWTSTLGVWQAYRNPNSIFVAHRIAGIEEV